NAYGKGRFPAAFQQILERRSHRDRFLAPRGQSKKRANSNATKTCLIPALGTQQPPAKIFFWSGQMQLIINGAVIGFLVDNETFRAGLNNRNIVLNFHRSDFNRDRGKILAQSADAFGKIIAANEFWMFARDEKELSETSSGQMPGFLYHFADRKSHAQNWIFA